MIMDKLFKRKIDLILTKSFHELAQVAKSDSELNGTISNGTWTNHKNIYVGYLSYYPGNDLSERSIDVTITLSFSENIIGFVADVCWSDGEVIKEIVEQNILFTTQSEFLSEVSELCNTVNQNALECLKSFLH